MGKNVLTPDVASYQISEDDTRIVELSVGTDMDNKPIYGVSEFVYEHSTLTSTKRGQLFTDRKEARKYYNELLMTPYYA